MVYKKNIWVTLQVEGFHSYPEAFTNPDLVDVRFLGFEHRHIFHLTVKIEVFNLDRDIEFIIFKRWLQSLYSTKKLSINNQSCEMIATTLAEVIHGKYPGRDITVDVAEDAENGACVVLLA